MTDLTFSTALRRMRGRCRLSQNQLGTVAGFDHSYLSRLESGTRRPTRNAVLRLATAMELNRVDRIELMASAGYLDDSVPAHLVVITAQLAEGHFPKHAHTEHGSVAR